MPIPSIYDLSPDALRALDFSRPLFVQASRPPHFDEVLEVVHARLDLPWDRSTLLTSVTYPHRPSSRATLVVRDDDRLTDRTVAHVPGLAHGAFSVIVLTSTVQASDRYAAMRYQSNLACFAHAAEPTPVVVVTGEGQIVPAREMFQIVDQRVGGVTLTGNIQIAQTETNALFEAARTRADGHVVELGRFSGGTAMLLAQAGRASGRPGVVSADIERLPAAEYFFRVNGLAEDITLLHGDSLALAREWPSLVTDPRIGLLFIDADHGYDAVARDLAAWTPYLVEGGTLALHDVGSPDCGVGRAVYYHLAHNPAFGGRRLVTAMFFCQRERRAA